MNRDPFAAIADPTRRAILMLLAVQAMTPNALAANFSSSRQAISKHLRILTESSLLEPDRSGREVFYHLNPKRLNEIDRWLEAFRATFEQRFEQLDSILNQLKTDKK